MKKILLPLRITHFFAWFWGFSGSGVIFINLPWLQKVIQPRLVYEKLPQSLETLKPFQINAWCVMGLTIDVFSFGHTYFALCPTKLYQVGPKRKNKILQSDSYL